MKKLAVTLTTMVLILVLIHGTGMTEFNEDLAMNIGFTLMSIVSIHGIFESAKWIKRYIKKKQLNKMNQGRTSKIMISATVITIIQRVSGILVILLGIPHGILGGNAPIIITVLFILVVTVHMLIGIPKWLVSIGLLNKKMEERFSIFYGGKGKDLRRQR